MKSLLMAFTLVAASLLSTPAVATAQPQQASEMQRAPNLQRARDRVRALHQRLQAQRNAGALPRQGRDWSEGASPVAVPELDPRAASSALALLLGGLLVLTDRRRLSGL